MNKRAWSLVSAVMILALLAACMPAELKPEETVPEEEPVEEGPPTDAPAPPAFTPDLTATALWQMVEASETAGAIQSATATALAAAETATEQALVDAAETQNWVYVAETETAAPGATASALAAATQTAEARRTLVIDDPADDGMDCMSGEAVAEMTPQDDLRTLTLSSEAGNMLVRAQYAVQEVQAAMLAANLLYGLTIGVNNPDKPLPPEDPANPFAAAANFYLQAAWFLTTGTLLTMENEYDQDQWLTINTLEGVLIQVQPTEVRLLIPLQHFPEEGKMLAGVVRDNRVCDYAGLSGQPPYQPLIHFVIIDGVPYFDQEVE